MFEFIEDDWFLTPDKLQEKTEYLIKDFIVKQGLTMWYAKEGQGKTWFSLAVANHILEHHDVDLLYMDMDNPRRNIAERNINHLFAKHKNFKMLHRSTISESPYNLLLKLGAKAHGNNYQDGVFFFDATRDFVNGDMSNDTKVREMMDVLKNIREAGGTIILNHHTTKNGRGIDGSGEFTKSLDSLYLLSQQAKSNGSIHYKMSVEKERSSITDHGFSVRVDDLTLMELDPTIAGMSKEDELFTCKVKDELEKHNEGINQSKLLENIGYKKTDKAVRARLESFVGKFWNVSDGANRQKIYRLSA